MDAKKQEQLTLVADTKFVIPKLDPTDSQCLIDVLISCTENLENAADDINPVITSCIDRIQKCISDNNLKVPLEVTNLIGLFSAFLPK
ncbi:hypothetical protein [Clostridium sp. BJN0001]|uniref:hypothetical protein n=1 Tax=Clostridium sp. BJN0001 TaxID=2930219 RepID=UPI001FD231F6|nr:hypothetical protein [Clostridium sp. BJN0001]